MKLIFLAFVIILSGCSPKVYIKTETVLDFHLSGYQKIFFNDNFSTVEEQNALVVLKEALRKYWWFIVTDNKEETGLWLSIKMKNESYSSSSFMPITTYSGGKPHTIYIPVTSHSSYKKTWIDLVQFQDLSWTDLKAPLKNRVVWSGFTSIESDQYNIYEKQIMQILSQLMWKNFKGYKTLKWIKE